MSHKRTKLRQAVQDKLKASAGVTALVASERIFKTRLVQLPARFTNAISIYTLDETGAKTASEDDLERIINVMISVWQTGKDNATIGTGEESIDDKLDNIFQAIEDEFFTKFQNLRDVWPTGEKPPYRLNYTDTKIKFEDEGELILAIATMKFDAIFHQGLPQQL